MNRNVKILIVDDHFVVRQGLKLILSEHYPGAVFGEAGTAHEAMQLAWRENWDVVLLDISMPGRGGLEVLKDLRQQFEKLPVMIISMHPEEQFALRVLKLGASGYIQKDGAGQELVNAVEAALRGGKYITPTVAERLASNLQRKEDGPKHESLSDREYQVFSLLARGKTVKEIGNELSLSAKTVSTYRARLMEKLELDNTSQLIIYAMQHRLTDPEPEG